MRLRTHWLPRGRAAERSLLGGLSTLMASGPLTNGCSRLRQKIPPVFRSMHRQIRRREFMILLGAAAAAWPLAARAQQPDRVRRVGVLMGIADDFEGQARIAIFRQALQALGWSEGRNIQFIYRWSGGDVAHARQFAKELLDLRSGVILTSSTAATVAVRDITRATPTIFVPDGD